MRDEIAYISSMEVLNILRHIYESDKYGYVDLGEFIKTNYPDLPCENIKDNIEYLVNNNKIHVKGSDYKFLCVERKIRDTHNTILRTVYNTEIFAALTESGRQEIETIDLRNDVNTVNKSVRDTNYWIKRTSIMSVVIATITGVFIAGEFFKDASPDLQPINTQLKQIEQQLDSMRKSQKGIDSSLRKAVIDSFYQK